MPLSNRTMLAVILLSLLSTMSSRNAHAENSEQIIVAATPIDSSAEAFYAQDMGFFKRAGLNATVVSTNVNAMVPAVLSGTATIGTLTVPSLAIAREKGIPLTIIAPAAIYSSAEPTSGIIVLRSSPLRTAADLNGKTISTRDLSNMSYYGGIAWIDKNGGDSRTVHWIEGNDATAIAAMQQGRIDAASVSEPALDAAIHGEGRLFAPVYDAIGDTFLIGAYFTTQAYARDHPDVVKKVANAIVASGKWANANRAASGKVLAKYAGVAIPPGYTRVAYAERLRPADAQPVLDVLATYGVLKAPARAADLFSPIVFSR